MVVQSKDTFSLHTTEHLPMWILFLKCSFYFVFLKNAENIMDRQESIYWDSESCIDYKITQQMHKERMELNFRDILTEEVE